MVFIMTRDQFKKLVRAEIKESLKTMIPAMVKQLVQESVAGALANLLAEGIVKGPPKQTKPTSKQTDLINSLPTPSNISEVLRCDDNTQKGNGRTSLRISPEDIGYNQEDLQMKIPESNVPTNDTEGPYTYSKILNEIAAEGNSAEFNVDRVPVKSILDVEKSKLPEQVRESVSSIIKDYSALLEVMESKRR